MFQKLSEHIYVRPHQDYTDRPNIGYVRGARYALLFDAGNSAANATQLKEELDRQGLPRPDFVTLSHWHWDHSFGLHAWEGLHIAGSQTNRKLAELSRWAWDDESMAQRVARGEDIDFCSRMIQREYPDRSQIRVVPAALSFEGSMSLDLGSGVVCRLIHAKGPHAGDSVICHVPGDRFLFLGDSNGKDLYGKLWHFDPEHEEKMVESLQQIPYDRALVEEYISLLDTLDFTHCIGGHAELMSRQELYRSLAE